MSDLSDFEHTKLDVHVHPDFVVQTQNISDPITGQRRVLKAQIWSGWAKSALGECGWKFVEKKRSRGK
jgi:hypothetical protein